MKRTMYRYNFKLTKKYECSIDFYDLSKNKNKTKTSSFSITKIFWRFLFSTFTKTQKHILFSFKKNTNSLVMQKQMNM